MTNPPDLKKMKILIVRYASMLVNFPDTSDKLTSVAEAFCEFAKLEPETLSSGPVVPAEWMMAQIRRDRKFFPTPAEARAIYYTKFRPLDGIPPSMQTIERPEKD